MRRPVLLTEPIRVPPTPALRRWSVDHGFSPELVARWGEFYPDLKGLVAAMQKPVPTYIRLNGLRGEPRDTVTRLRAKGFKVTAGPLPGSAMLEEAPFSPGATTEYLLGTYFLQDLSSQLAPLALLPKPGDRVADLCAAPGGKTVAMADQMRNKGAIAAFDPDVGRHQALVSNLARCGVINCAAWAKPGQSAAALEEAFDAVLLDAPCTGEGVVARDPTRKQGQLQEFAACSREQASLMDTAHGILRPGGVLVYATCTLAPEENELQVDAAVQSGRFRIEQLPEAVRDAKIQGQRLWPGMATVGGKDLHPDMKHTFHALPHQHGCLGFYVARLRKEAS